jgi:hypothetical protein
MIPPALSPVHIRRMKDMNVQKSHMAAWCLTQKRTKFL